MDFFEKKIAIDIGNSFIKIKYYDNDEIHFIHSDEFTSDNLKQYFYTKEKIDSAIISSVNTEMESQIVNVLADNNVTIYLVDSLLRKQNIIDFSNVDGMGNDRKVGFFGALKYVSSPIITVDCGTAITINILSKDNICLGGAIMCGVGTQARALEHFTSSLPIVKINFKSSVNIDNTVGAINSGIISAVKGGVIDFISNVIFKKDLQNVNIIFSGGYSSYVFKLCKNRFNKFQTIKSVDVKNNIVLYGLEKLMETFNN